MAKTYLTANEVAEIMGVSISKAYQVIRTLNNQLEENGYYVIAGKINKRFFEEKCCYGSDLTGE